MGDRGKDQRNVTIGGQTGREEKARPSHLTGELEFLKKPMDCGTSPMTPKKPEKFDSQTLSGNVTVYPKLVYGLRTDVVGNVNFNVQNEVIYPVEGVLAFHDYVQKTQRFIHFPENIRPELIAISEHRKLLAVVERSNNNLSIEIYDLVNMRKRRTLDIPPALLNKKITQLQFIPEGKGVVFFLKAPDEVFYMMLFDKDTSTFECYPAPNVSLRGSIQCVCCHPTEVGVVAACGANVFVFWKRSEKNFFMGTTTRLLDCKAICMCFVSPEFAVLGTDDEHLLIVKNGVLKIKIPASRVNMFDMAWDQEAYNRDKRESKKDPADADRLKKYKRVALLTAFPHGLCFVVFNEVFVFEKVSPTKYEKKTVLQLPINLYPEPLYQITSLALDYKFETIVVTAKHPQIYVGILIVPETLKARQLKLVPLGPLIHIAEIIDISVCCWKPIIMTVSRDRTIRIWNYETDEMELIRKFQMEITLVELFPTGMMAAVGFTEQLRLTNIMLEELSIIKTYNFPYCKAVKFSNMGHLMASAYGTHVTITSTNSFDILITFNGHTGNVLDIAFTRDDLGLVSGGADGRIFLWDVVTGEPKQEIIREKAEYLAVCVTAGNPLSIYAATQFCSIHEYQESKLKREIVMPTRQKCRLTSLCLSRSDLVMYASDELGGLYNVHMPLLSKSGPACTRIRFFTSKITRMCFTYCGTLLLMTSSSGTLVIGKLDNLEGRVLPHDDDLLKSTEIVMPRALLREKMDQIADLENKLKKQSDEFQFQLSQTEKFDGQQLAEVHKTYCGALDDLKQKNVEIRERHAEEMDQVQLQIKDIKEEQRKQLNTLNDQYSERINVEFLKFTKLRDSMFELRESYDDKLKRSAATLKDTVEALEKDYKRQLDERRHLIRQLMKDMQEKRIEFVEYCNEVETENDRKLVDTQLTYEHKLTAERTELENWRLRAGLLQEKFDNMNCEVENLMEEVATLKEEHQNNLNEIVKLNGNIEDLQRDIADRDIAINVKEQRIQDLSNKNTELDKYKLVLSHKIYELKALLEPKEYQINDKRKHILEMEKELAGLHQNNQSLELQLQEMRDKFLSNMADLKLERHRARAGRECIQSICTEIYYVTAKLKSPQSLKAAIKDMFKKHEGDDGLRRFISLDAQVRDELQRQRAQIERVLDIYNNRKEDNDKTKYAKLYKQYRILLTEIEKLREENEKLRSRVQPEACDLSKSDETSPAFD